MSMARKAPRRTVVLGALLLLLLVMMFAVNYYYAADTVTRSSESYSNIPLANGNTSSSRNTHSPNATMDNESLRYIPQSTLQTWSERDYLIVFGIPSVDIASRRSRRNLQRTTCWKFPGVARRANNFTGDMLVLYVLARHPTHGYRYSAALLKEVEEYHDVITLPINEGRSTTKKRISGKGYWGNEAEIGVSRKTYLWFQLALRFFPVVAFISKGDDDMFLRVPQFLADLRRVPRRGLYMGGYYGVWRGRKAKPPNVYFIIGYCMTLARDVAEQLVSFKPIHRLVHLPYSKERDAEFMALNMEHEDIMVESVQITKGVHHSRRL